MKEQIPYATTSSQEADRDNIAIEIFDATKHSSVEIALRHLEIRLWQELRGENTFSDIMDSQTELRNIDKIYIEGGGQFFVASCSHDEIAGFVGLKLEQGIAELKRLAVMPEFQGQGIGNRLVTLAVDWAKRQHCSKVKLVTGYQERASKIYLRHGFEIVGNNDEKQDFLMELNFSR